MPLPSFAVAVIMTVFPPAAFLIVTIPLLFTVAYLVLLDFQVTALFVALAGDTATLSLSFFPAAILLLEPMILSFFTITPFPIFPPGVGVFVGVGVMDGVTIGVGDTAGVSVPTLGVAVGVSVAEGGVTTGVSSPPGVTVGVVVGVTAGVPVTEGSVPGTEGTPGEDGEPVTDGVPDTDGEGVILSAPIGTSVPLPSVNTSFSGFPSSSRTSNLTSWMSILSSSLISSSLSSQTLT